MSAPFHWDPRALAVVELLEPGDIVQQACGDFDPTVYTDYLEDKFRRLYNLK